MKFLADENLPGPVVRRLRALGHDVLWVKETMPAAPDEEVLTCASAQARTLVTCDKDFGELAFRRGLPALSGVVLLRLSGDQPEVDNQRALAALTGFEDWVGRFAVVTDQHVRIRLLKP